MDTSVDSVQNGHTLRRLLFYDDGRIFIDSQHHLRHSSERQSTGNTVSRRKSRIPLGLEFLDVHVDG